MVPVTRIGGASSDECRVGCSLLVNGIAMTMREIVSNAPQYE
jgi:hypothetical protein